MDEITKQALLKSIEHWRENEAVLSVDEARFGASHCALCNLFNIPDSEEDACLGCPVREAVDAIWCQKSPFHDAYETHDDWGEWELVSDAGVAHPFIAYWRLREGFKLAARDERLFLESLLPGENGND